MEAAPTEFFSRNLSMGEYLERAYRRAPRALACTARTEQDWRDWRQAFTGQLRSLMAPWPKPCALDPLVLERVQCDGYVREKVLFFSERDMCVPVYVLIPEAAPVDRRCPAVICQHGHGYGKDDVVGLTHGTLQQWRLGQREQYAYGVALARGGYVVLAMDARGFGERALGYAFGSGDARIGDDSCHGCNIVQMKAQLLGLNMFTLNVFDLIRCLDYLTTRPDVDPARIACAGLSYGAALTLFSAALDERIKVAVVSGFVASLYDETFVHGDTCGQQVVPRLLEWGEISDVACLIAPRPLLVESGTEDELFGIEAARQAVTAVRQLYDALHVPELVMHHVFAGGHRWDGKNTLAWLERWL